MTAHGTHGPDSSTLVELEARRAASKKNPSVSVRLHRSGRWTIVEIEGEMDIQVHPLIPELHGSNAAHVVFELHGVTFLDASGLGMMVDSQRRAMERGGCVRLVAPSHQARQLLMLTDSEQVFLMFDSLDEALSTPVDPRG